MPLLAGLAANRPAHPALGGGVDRILQGLALVQTVLDVVGKVASVAAVEEDPHRFEGLVVASEMAVMAKGHAALACSFIVPQKPQASFWVVGIWLLVMAFSPSG
jgi:hypothetical protein